MDIPVRGATATGAVVRSSCSGGRAGLTHRPVVTVEHAPWKWCDEVAWSGSLSSQATEDLEQLTMFTHSMQLTPNFRVRWTIDDAAGTIDIGLEGVVSDGTGLSFGPAVRCGAPV